MKSKYILLLLFPMFSYSQFHTIGLNVSPNSLNIIEGNVSNSILEFLKLSNEYSFKLIEEKTSVDRLGYVHYTYQQQFKGYDVENAVLKLHYKDSKLYYINGEYLSIKAESFEPRKSISETQAFEIALRNTNASTYIWDDDKRLSILPRNKGTELLFPQPHGVLVVYSSANESEKGVFLTYKFDIYSTKPMTRNYVFVDANSGKVVAKHNRIHHATGTADTRYSGTQSIETELNSSIYRLRDYTRGDGIETYNMQWGGPSDYTAAVDYTDGDNNWSSSEFNNTDKDNAALDVHWGSMMAYDYWLNIHGQNGFDGNGGKFVNYVKADLQQWGFQSQDNAFWNGSFVTYGNGSYLFDAVTSIDFVGHEFGHGLSDYSANFVYANESGAIDEGLSDIWGACIENYATTSKSTWVYAEDITELSPYYYRSMSNPNSGFVPQPDTYGGTHWQSQVSCTPLPNNDSCGVHTNSGVMNFWFYLLSVGGSGTNDNSHSYNVAGVGIDDAAAIVFRAETEYMTANTNFANARTYTIQAAQDIFGNCSPEVISTINAWYAVGVGSSYAAIDEKLVTLTYSAPTTDDVYAVTKLEANNLVSSGTNITYQSSQKVILLPGFKAEAGGNFLAQIIPCKDLGLAKKERSKVLDKHIPVNATNDNTVNIYPNPTNNFFTVSIDGEEDVFNSIGVYDMYGRKIAEVDINSNKTVISVYDIVSGTYLVKLVSPNEVITRKIIIKK